MKLLTQHWHYLSCCGKHFNKQCPYDVHIQQTWSNISIHFTLWCCSNDKGTVCESEAVNFNGVGTCAKKFFTLFRLEDVAFQPELHKKSL